MFDFRFNTHSYLPESGSRKHFQDSGMRTIYFPHEITPRNIILREEFQNFSIFASILKKIFKNDPIRGNFIRGIDCAHSRSLNTLSWPWIREIRVCIEAKIWKFWIFLLKIIVPGVILSEGSEKHAPESKKMIPIFNEFFGFWGIFNNFVASII